MVFSRFNVWLNVIGLTMKWMLLHGLKIRDSSTTCRLLNIEYIPSWHLQNAVKNRQRIQEKFTICKEKQKRSKYMFNQVNKLLNQHCTSCCHWKYHNFICMGTKLDLLNQLEPLMESRVATASKSFRGVMLLILKIHCYNETQF